MGIALGMICIIAGGAVITTGWVMPLRAYLRRQQRYFVQQPAAEQTQDDKPKDPLFPAQVADQYILETRERRSEDTSHR